MAKSPVIDDAERRMIRAAGMPFPIDEASKDRVHKQFEACPECKQKSVPLSLIVATQRDIDDEHVQKMLHKPDEEPIDVVSMNGKYYLDDGHHRAVAARYRGESTIPARVAS